MSKVDGHDYVPSSFCSCEQRLFFFTNPLLTTNVALNGHMLKYRALQEMTFALFFPSIRASTTISSKHLQNIFNFDARRTFSLIYFMRGVRYVSFWNASLLWEVLQYVHICKNTANTASPLYQRVSFFVPWVFFRASFRAYRECSWSRPLSPSASAVRPLFSFLFSSV